MKKRDAKNSESTPLLIGKYAAYLQVHCYRRDKATGEYVLATKPRPRPMSFMKFAREYLGRAKVEAKGYPLPLHLDGVSLTA